jgi:hypothetical protein
MVALAVGAAAAIGGAAVQKRSADKATKAAKKGRDQQLAFMREGRDTAMALTQPYRDAGTQALTAMQGMLGLGGQSYDVTTDPGYQFRFGEGVRAMDASASARGGLLSGGALKELTGYGQDMASQEYMNIFKRLQTLAGGGMNAINTASNAAMGAGTNMAGAAGDFANTAASGHVAGGNIAAGLMGDLGSLAGDWAGSTNQTNSSAYRPSAGQVFGKGGNSTGSGIFNGMFPEV